MFTDPKTLQILEEEQAANDAFFAEMDAKIQDARDNTPDEQIWTTPNQRRLIAAAPELLATLKGLTREAVKLAETQADNAPIWAWIDDAADVIHKAEGK